MSLHRGLDGSEPLRPQPVGGVAGWQEERRAARTAVLATGTLACPACDAPVAPDRALAPAEPLACPYCGHGGAVREFLSLDPPVRPARVVVRVTVV